MRLIIIPEDKFVSIDNEGIHGVDMTWIPEFIGDITGVSQKVHALQWYDDHGEIELESRDNNIVITELGVFEEAIAKHAERKLAIEEAKEAEIVAARETEEEINFEAILKLLQEDEEDGGYDNVGIATT